MDWFHMCIQPHERTIPQDGKLSSLPTEWERELAALWRLEADVNNGAYVQFLCNWGDESHDYASQALKKIGAKRMAQIVDQCHALVVEHVADAQLDYDRTLAALPKRISKRIHTSSWTTPTTWQL